MRLAFCLFILILSKSPDVVNSAAPVAAQASDFDRLACLIGVNDLVIADIDRYMMYRRAKCHHIACLHLTSADRFAHVSEVFRSLATDLDTRIIERPRDKP